MLIGSAASKPVVAATLTSGFGVPVIRSKVASAAAAAGAALAVQPESVDLFALERSRLSRGAAALVAAASVLAGGLVVGGVYEATTSSRTTTAPVLADAHAPAQAHRMRSVEQAPPARGRCGPVDAVPGRGQAGGPGRFVGWGDRIRRACCGGPTVVGASGLGPIPGHSDGPDLSPARRAPGRTGPRRHPIRPLRSGRAQPVATVPRRGCAAAARDHGVRAVVGQPLADDDGVGRGDNAAGLSGRISAIPVRPGPSSGPGRTASITSRLHRQVAAQLGDVAGGRRCTARARSCPPRRRRRSSGSRR